MILKLLCLTPKITIRKEDKDSKTMGNSNTTNSQKTPNSTKKGLKTTWNFLERTRASQLSKTNSRTDNHCLSSSAIRTKGTKAWTTSAIISQFMTLTMKKTLTTRSVLPKLRPTISNTFQTTTSKVMEGSSSLSWVIKIKSRVKLFLRSCTWGLKAIFRLR